MVTKLKAIIITVVTFLVLMVSRLMKPIQKLCARLCGNDALLVLKNEVTGKKQYIWGRSRYGQPSPIGRLLRIIPILPAAMFLGIVTTAGNVWYAQSSCGESPTNTFANLYLATTGPETPAVGDDYSDFTVVAGSSKAKTAGYPKTADADADNTGAGATVVTWAFAYTTGDGPFATSITHSFIAKSGASGTDPVLNSYKWAAGWTKDASTSAKIFANHTILGS